MQQLKTIFKIISIIAVAFSLAIGVYIVSSNSGTDTQKIVGLVWALLGIIWATTGIILNWTNLNNAFTEVFKRRKRHTNKFIRESDDFVNRKTEVREISKLISGGIINVFGPKGSGKSETLKMLCDLINGFHKVPKTKTARKNLKSQNIKIGLYFDLNDAKGIQGLISQITTTLRIVDQNSFIEIAHYLSGTYKNNPIVIILDNINAKSAGNQLLESMKDYLAIRPTDTIIIGSVEKIFDIYNQTKYYQISPLSENGIIEYLEAKIKGEYDLDMEKITSRTRGLPIFLNLVILELQNEDRLAFEITIEEYLINKILNKLNEKSKILLLRLAYINLTSTLISLDSLDFFYINSLGHELNILRNYSTIIDVVIGKKSYIKLHDLIRDLLVKNSTNERDSLNREIQEMYRSKGDKHRALLHWFLTKKNKNEFIENYDFLLENLKVENYSFFESAWNINSLNITDEGNQSDIEINQLILFGYVKTLLSFGDYKGAETLISSRKFIEFGQPDLRSIESEFQLEVHFALADVDHLLNRYKSSYELLEIVYSLAFQHNYKDIELNALWLRAHILGGHLGTNINQAIEMYNLCIDIAKDIKNQTIELKCINGIFALRSSINIYEPDHCLAVDRAIDRCKKQNGCEPILSSLLRNKARYFRRIDAYDEAIQTIDESFELARSNKLRTVYNCYLSYGDIDRFRGKFESSIKFYSKVIEFTKENGDRHLMSSAIGGIVISELCSNNLLYYKSITELEEDIYKWTKITEELDLNISNFRFELINVYFSILHNRNHSFMSNHSALAAAAARLHLNYELEFISMEDFSYIQKMEMHIH